MQKMKQRVDENVQSTREVAQARGSWRVGGTQRSFLANPLLFLGEKAPFEDVSGSDREHDYVLSITIFESRELMDFQEDGEHDDIEVQEGIHDGLDDPREVSDKTAF
jgi:hypothetical protein